VIATLYFTTPDEPHTLEWTPAALDELAAEIESNISGAIDTVDSRTGGSAVPKFTP
jgi:hypothetical protein